MSQTQPDWGFASRLMGAIVAWELGFYRLVAAERSWGDVARMTRALAAYVIHGPTPDKEADA